MRPLQQTGVVVALEANQRPACLVRDDGALVFVNRAGRSLASSELELARAGHHPQGERLLLLHAVRDAAVPLELGRELCTLGSNARLEVLDVASHMLPITHAAHVARAVFMT